MGNITEAFEEFMTKEYGVEFIDVTPKGIRLLVCGSRSAKDCEALWTNLDLIKPKEIIHGGAQGADACDGSFVGERSQRIRNRYSP